MPNNAAHHTATKLLKPVQASLSSDAYHRLWQSIVTLVEAGWEAEDDAHRRAFEAGYRAALTAVGGEIRRINGVSTESAEALALTEWPDHLRRYASRLK